MAETRPAAAATSRPIWDGLFDTDADGPYIIGGRCEACGGMALATRSICPHCHVASPMAAAKIGRRGTLYSATIVHQGPEGFAAPYRIGYVDIEGAVRVFAHIDGGPAGPALGAPVSLRIQTLRTKPTGPAEIGPFYVAAPKSAGGKP